LPSQAFTVTLVLAGLTSMTLAICAHSFGALARSHLQPASSSSVLVLSGVRPSDQVLPISRMASMAPGLASL
jgi:hypothetical protein